MKRIAVLLITTLMLGLCGGIAVTAEETTTTTRVGQRFDFDGSRGRTVADAVILLRHIDGHDDGIVAEGEGDVNGDGRTSVYDAVCFLRLLLNDEFTVEDTLKIATYNIKCGYYNQGQTLDTVAQVLIDTDADIVGLQEVDYLSNRSSASGDQLAYLKEKTGYPYYYYAPVLQLGNSKVPLPEGVTQNIYGHGILSKYPINSYELIYFTVQGTESDGTASEIRAVARYEIQVGDKTVAFYNSHLNGTVGRAQYQEVQDNYMIHDQYAIFTADMNETYAELEGYLNEDRFELLTDNSRIDHIIVSNDTIGWYVDENGNSDVSVTSYEVPTFQYTNKGNTYTITKRSDHDLKYAQIYLKDE